MTVVGARSSLLPLGLLTLRQYLHGKRWIVVALLFLLPAALAILVRCTARDVPDQFLEFLLVFMFIPQALLPLLALIYSSGMIQDEQEEQTITYLLIRPISRWALYLVKLLATLITVVALIAIFTALTSAAIYIGTGQEQQIVIRCLKAIGIHALAGVCYCCLFGLVSLLTTRTLVAGVIYTALVEGLFANLPFGIRLFTVIYYSRLLAYRSLSFVAPERRGPVDLGAEVWQLDIVKDPQLLEHPSRLACILVLVCASVAFAAVAAFICSRREFHVKTPEQA